MIVKEAYKNKKSDKVITIYCRVDEIMNQQLCKIRNQTGISLSELIREGARRIIADAKDKGEAKLI
jgi:hypothetical protein